MTAAVEIRNLTKIYPPPVRFNSLLGSAKQPGNRALDNLSFSVERGIIYGLLGENGAGKTTLLKILGTTILPTSGGAFVSGMDLLKKTEQVKRRIGFVSSRERSFYWRLTGKQNLMFFARLHGLKDDESRERIEQLLNEFDLADKAHLPFKDYSSGMKQRFSIIRGLLHDPDVIFLDEPTRSLDPRASHRIVSHLRRLNERENITVFMATHDVEEAKNLCSRIGIIGKGKLIWEGTPDELADRDGTNVYFVEYRGGEGLPEGDGRVIGREMMKNGNVRLTVDPRGDVKAFLGDLLERDVELINFSRSMESAEDSVLRIIEEGE